MAGNLRKRKGEGLATSSEVDEIIDDEGSARHSGPSAGNNAPRHGEGVSTPRFTADIPQKNIAFSFGRPPAAHRDAPAQTQARAQAQPAYRPTDRLANAGTSSARAAIDAVANATRQQGTRSVPQIGGGGRRSLQIAPGTSSNAMAHPSPDLPLIPAARRAWNADKPAQQSDNQLSFATLAAGTRTHAAASSSAPPPARNPRANLPAAVNDFPSSSLQSLPSVPSAVSSTQTSAHSQPPAHVSAHVPEALNDPEQTSTAGLEPVIAHTESLVPHLLDRIDERTELPTSSPRSVVRRPQQQKDIDKGKEARRSPYDTRGLSRTYRDGEQPSSEADASSKNGGPSSDGVDQGGRATKRRKKQKGAAPLEEQDDDDGLAAEQAASSSGSKKPKQRAPPADKLPAPAREEEEDMVIESESTHGKARRKARPSVRKKAAAPAAVAMSPPARAVNAATSQIETSTVPATSSTSKKQPTEHQPLAPSMDKHPAPATLEAEQSEPAQSDLLKGSTTASPPVASASTRGQAPPVAPSLKPEQRAGLQQVGLQQVGRHLEEPAPASIAAQDADPHTASRVASKPPSTSSQHAVTCATASKASASASSSFPSAFAAPAMPPARQPRLLAQASSDPFNLAPPAHAASATQAAPTMPSGPPPSAGLPLRKKRNFADMSTPSPATAAKLAALGEQRKTSPLKRQRTSRDATPLNTMSMLPQGRKTVGSVGQTLPDAGTDMAQLSGAGDVAMEVAGDPLTVHAVADPAAVQTTAPSVPETGSASVRSHQLQRGSASKEAGTRGLAPNQAELRPSLVASTGPGRATPSESVNHQNQPKPAPDEAWGSLLHSITLSEAAYRSLKSAAQDFAAKEKKIAELKVELDTMKEKKSKYKREAKERDEYARKNVHVAGELRKAQAELASSGEELHTARADAARVCQEGLVSISQHLREHFEVQEAELWVLLKSKGVRLDETRPEPAQAKLAVQLLLGKLHELYSAHETSAVKAVQEQVATPDLTDELSQAQALLADLEAVNATQAGLIHTLTEERQTLADQIDQLHDSQTKASATHLQTYTRLSKSLADTQTAGDEQIKYLRGIIENDRAVHGRETTALQAQIKEKQRALDELTTEQQEIGRKLLESNGATMGRLEQTELAAARRQSSSLSNQLESLRQKAREDAAAATSAQTAQNGEWRMDQQLRESQARVLELVAEKTAQNAELDFAKATVPELASRLRDLLASSSAGKQPENIAQIITALNEVPTDDLRGQCTAVLLAVGALYGHVEGLRSALIQSTTEVADLKAEASKNQQQQAELTSRLQGRDAEAASAKAASDVLLAELRTKVDGLDAQAKRADSQLEAATRDRDAIRAECQGLASEKATLSIQLEAANTRIAEAERWVAESMRQTEEQRDAQTAAEREARAGRDAALKDQQKLFDAEREQLRSQHRASVEAKHAELLAARVENGMLTGAQSQLHLRCTGAENALAAIQTELQEARQAQAAASAKSTDLMRASEEKEAELLKLQLKIDGFRKVEAEKQQLKQQLDQARAERAEAHRLKEEAASAHALAVTQSEESIEAWRAELETYRQAAQEKDAQAAQAQAGYETTLERKDATITALQRKLEEHQNRMLTISQQKAQHNNQRAIPQTIASQTTVSEAESLALTSPRAVTPAEGPPSGSGSGSGAASSTLAAHLSGVPSRSVFTIGGKLVSRPNKVKQPKDAVSPSPRLPGPGSQVAPRKPASKERPTLSEISSLQTSSAEALEGGMQGQGAEEGTGPAVSTEELVQIAHDLVHTQEPAGLETQVPRRIGAAPAGYAGTQDRSRTSKPHRSTANDVDESQDADATMVDADNDDTKEALEKGGEDRMQRSGAKPLSAAAASAESSTSKNRPTRTSTRKNSTVNNVAKNTKGMEGETGHDSDLQSQSSRKRPRRT